MRSLVPVLLRVTVFAFVVVALVALERRSPATPLRPAHAPAPPIRGASALAFHENVGQFDDAVRFVGRGRHYTIGSVDGRIELAAGGDANATVGIAFANATGPTRVAGESPQDTRVHYLKGRPDEWRTNVPVYGRLRYEQVWPGVDVVLYGSDDWLEYDVVVAPGADPSRVRLRFDGVSRMTLDARGDLQFETTRGEVRQKAPVAYQLDDAGARTPVRARYVRQGTTGVGIEVGTYDTSRPLVLDPVVTYATYLGGTGGEFWVDSNVAGLIVEPLGRVIVAGDTGVPNFSGQTNKDLRIAPGQRDIFIARLDPTGSQLLSVTILGGSGIDDRASLGRSASGEFYLSGRTTSPNLPTTPTALQTLPQGGADGFVCRLNAAADTLTYMSYVGGTGYDAAQSLAVSSDGVVALAGTTNSPNFPVTQGVRQPTIGGQSDVWVMKLDLRVPAVNFSTYLGGLNAELAGGVGMDAAGRVVVSGQTLSQNFPVAAPLRATLSGGSDAFVSALDPTGAQLLYSTYVGGSSPGTGETARVVLGPGGADDVYLVGITDSNNLPTTSAAQPTSGGQLDGFVAHMTFNGVALAQGYATYLGGPGNDAAFDLALASDGTAYVVGGTQSASFPPPVDAFDTTLGGTQDAFLVRLAANGQTFLHGSYFGGSGIDTALALDIDPYGDVFVIGQTTSQDLPTVGAFGRAPFDSTANGVEDAFVLRVSVDFDRDGLPDQWETANGLDPNDATGNNGASGDPDRDQVPNSQEFLSGTSPIRSERYFAEGSTAAPGFSTQFALLNPWTDVTTNARLEFATLTGQTVYYPGPTAAETFPILPTQRKTIQVPTDVPALVNSSFSTTVYSDYGVAADRTMSWANTGYGSSAESGILSPSTRWYLAEGATHSNFKLFYLLQNPTGQTAQVRVTYLRPAPAPPITADCTIPPHTRKNIYVNIEVCPGPGAPSNPGLASTDVSAVFESSNGIPIIVERAMYQSPGFELYAGTASAAVTQPSANWFLAEGSTGEFFDTFVLLANPSPLPATVEVTFLRQGGTPVAYIDNKTSGATSFTLAPNSRKTIWVDLEPGVENVGGVSTLVRVTNGVGILAERSMWWPGPTAATWTEAHNSFGTTVTGVEWALAEGESGGTYNSDTYVLIANTSATEAFINLTIAYEDGTTTVLTPTQLPRLRIPAQSRQTVGINYDVPGITGKRYGVIVQSVAGPGVPTPAQIVVERAMYSTDIGVQFSSAFKPGFVYWPAGTNSLGIRLQ